MGLKDVVVHVDASKAGRARIEAAARLAREHEGHLAGLFVVEFPVLPSYAEVQVPAAIVKSQRDARLAEAASCEKIFQEIADREGVSAEWRCVEGDVVDELVSQSRYADLLVLGQADRNDSRAPRASAVQRVVLECGRPVLLVPRTGAPVAIGRCVLVAWNNRREAVRAVSDALPLLQRSRRVIVLTVNPEAEDPDDAGIPAADISLHLARHGVATEARGAYGAPAAIGELLLSTARDEGADLLVMGAYGRSRFRELVLGGATAHVLKHADVPTLLAH